MTKRDGLSRARDDDSKRKVRDAFIAAGRDLCAEVGADATSLRQIAIRAGYAPATIYKYFQGSNELMIAVREQELANIVAAQEAFLSTVSNPTDRARGIWRVAAQYWLDNPDQYMIFFGMSNRTKKNVAFNEGPIESENGQKLVVIYEGVLTEFAATCSGFPEPSKAIWTLMAISHGIVGFALGTPSLNWSDPLEMISEVIDLQLTRWSTPVAKLERDRARAT